MCVVTALLPVGHRWRQGGFSFRSKPTRAEVFVDRSSWYLVTGGTSGIGAAICGLLLARGASVIATFRSNRQRAEDFRRWFSSDKPHQLVLFKGDLTDPSVVNELVHSVKGTVCSSSEERKLRGIVHAAGFHTKDALKQHLGGGEDVLDVLDAYYSLYPRALVHLVEGLLPILEPGRGRIVLLTAPGSSPLTRPRSSYELPGQAKAAAENLIRSYALRLAPLGITANAVMPGITRTNAWTDISRVDLKSLAEQRSPMGKLLEPSVIAKAVWFLLSDVAADITGVVLPVDGGLHMV